MPDRVPVLWLCGPPGAGKSTVAWELFTAAGTPIGYVDIDQLGMCYPELPEDPGRYGQKSRNLGAVVAGFRAAGARGVIVSGVADPVGGLRAGLIPDGALTVCRLRADSDELRDRLTRRNTLPFDQGIAEHAAAMDRVTFADTTVDTTGLPVAEVVRLVGERTEGWLARAEPAVDHEAPATAPVPVLLVCGATAVGKSTVGWHVAELARAGGRTVAFVDLGQLGFMRPEPDDYRLQARNLAAMLPTFHDGGAWLTVAVGAAGAADALRGLVDLTVCRLHAGPERLAERVQLRGRGFGPGIAGDRLRGQPEGVLREAAARAAAEAEALERAGVGDVRVDTGEGTAEELAAEVLRRCYAPMGA